MTPEQKAAFINAQCAITNAKIAGMVSANMTCASQFKPPQYSEKDFEAASNDHVLGWNAVILFFED